MANVNEQVMDGMELVEDVVEFIDMEPTNYAETNGKAGLIVKIVLGVAGVATAAGVALKKTGKIDEWKMARAKKQAKKLEKMGFTVYEPESVETNCCEVVID